MKFFTLALATLLAQTVTIAQSLFKHQSNGFRLILKSIDKNFNEYIRPPFSPFLHPDR